MADRESTSIDFFNRKIKKSRLEKQMRRRKKFLKIGVVLSVVVGLLVVYFSMSISRVQTINVTGNRYLDKADVIAQSGVTTADYLLAALPFVVENRLKSNPLIEGVSVKWDFVKRIVQIDIVEKRLFGYRYDDVPYILFMNHQRIPMDKDTLKLLPYLPFINGFEAAELENDLIDSFVDVEEKMMNHIAEIFQYQTSYDDKMLRIVMRDGNQVFTTLQTVDVINYYYEIVAGLKVKQACIFIDEITRQAYTSSCPVVE